MATTIFNQTIATTYSGSTSKTSVYTNFINWCQGQESDRFLWLGLALAGHGCILTPLTGIAVVLAGANLVLFMMAIAAMAMVLVTNLAAMPTKITIPVFLLSILIDLGIVIAAAVTGFSLTNAF